MVQRDVATCKNNVVAKFMERKLRLRKVEQQPMVPINLLLQTPFE